MPRVCPIRPYGSGPSCKCTACVKQCTVTESSSHHPRPQTTPGGYPGTPFHFGYSSLHGYENVRASAAPDHLGKEPHQHLASTRGSPAPRTLEGSTGPVNSGRLSQDGDLGAAACARSHHGKGHAAGIPPHAAPLVARAGRRRLKGPRDLELDGGAGRRRGSRLGERGVPWIPAKARRKMSKRTRYTNSPKRHLHVTRLSFSPSPSSRPRLPPGYLLSTCRLAPHPGEGRPHLKAGCAQNLAGPRGLGRAGRGERW